MDSEQSGSGSASGTLGNLLYSDDAKRLISEQDWVGLVRAIAAGDKLALHALYAHSHRPAFTLIVRITGSRETADARDVLELQDRSRVLREALTGLTPEERQAIETAYFAELTYAEVATRLNQPLGTVKTRIRSGLHKLRQALGEGAKKR